MLGGLVSCSECKRVTLVGLRADYWVTWMAEAAPDGLYASFAAPSASSHTSRTTPGPVYLSTIPTVPATVMIMTLTWELTAMVALVGHSTTVGTQPQSGALLMAS